MIKNERDVFATDLLTPQELLKRATLRLGGTSGRGLIETADIQYYLAARLLLHLESGDSTSSDYQTLEQAQNLSTASGVLAALEVLRKQMASLEIEFSTPKDQRDRDLMREGLAFGVSIQKLEDSLFEVALADLEQNWHNLGGQTGNEVNVQQIQDLLGSALIHQQALTRRNPRMDPEDLALLTQAQNFTTSQEGRSAAVQFLNKATLSRVQTLRFELSFFNVTDYTFVAAMSGDALAREKLVAATQLDEEIGRTDRASAKAIELISRLPNRP